MKKNIAIIQSPKLSKAGDIRYIVINANTGETLDDAQGYGYKSALNAKRAWEYKNPESPASPKRITKQKNCPLFISSFACSNQHFYRRIF